MSCPLQHWGKYISGLEVTTSTKTFHKKIPVKCFDIFHLCMFLILYFKHGVGRLVHGFCRSSTPTFISATTIENQHLSLHGKYGSGIFCFFSHFCLFFAIFVTIILPSFLQPRWIQKKKTWVIYYLHFHFANVKHALELISSSTRVKVSTFP